jgi:prepilin peptidase CpaA
MREGVAPAGIALLPFGAEVRAPVGSGLLAVAAAAVASAEFVGSRGEAPLPAFWWAAAFLFVVVEEDLRARRIPNWLTAPALAVALTLGFLHSGLPGGGIAALGAATAFAALFPVFLGRGMGAGDVKALMVLGALWGPLNVLGALWWMLLVGGALGLVVVLARGLLLDLGRGLALSLSASVAARRPILLLSGAPARCGVPFGLAMALGASAYQYWGIPWL